MEAGSRNHGVDLNLLPGEYRKEVVDYYYSILEKYRKQKKQKGISDIVNFYNEILPSEVRCFTPLETDEIYE